MITELPDTGDTPVIADGDVDREQTAILALRNAGCDNPICVARSAAALISRLAEPDDVVPRPSAILVDSMLLLECGAELMHRLAAPGESPVKVVALVSNDRERRTIEQRGYSNVHYLKRPLRPEDVLRLFRANPSRKPSGNPQLLWPAPPFPRPSSQPLPYGTQ